MSSQSPGALLDTSFLIDYTDRTPETKAFLTEYKGERSEDVSIPTLVLYEMYRGWLRSDGPANIPDLDYKLRWANNVGFDRYSALEAAEIESELASQGELINGADILIAGIARRKEMLLVTADGDYSNVKGLDVFDVREDSLDSL